MGDSEKIPRPPRGWTNPMGPDPGLYPGVPETVPQPETGSGTANVGSGTANVGSGTANVGSGTANVGSGTPDVGSDTGKDPD